MHRIKRSFESVFTSNPDQRSIMSFPTRPHALIPPTHPYITHTGRWNRLSTPSTGITSSHSGCSISILFTGQFIYLRPGRKTARKSANSNPIIVWTVSEAGGKAIGELRKGDVYAGEDVCLIERGPEDGKGLLRLDMVFADWASVLHIEAFILECETSLQPRPAPPPAKSTPRLLFIGDSISCAFSQSHFSFQTRSSSSEIKNGVHDAWPFILKRWLEEEKQGAQVDVEVVAYPGITLVDLEPGRGMVVEGMVSKFWQESFWEETRWNFSGPDVLDERTPNIIFIALGTNDAGWGVSTEQFIEAMHDLIQRLCIQYLQTLEHIFVLTPFKPNRTDSVYEPELSDLLSPSSPLSSKIGSGNPKVLLHRVSTTGWLDDGLGMGGRKMTSDGIHPTLEGNQVIARRLLESVRGALCG